MKKTIETLKKGGVIIYPTDTLYGIGCDARNKKAVERVFKIKKRDFNNPVSVCGTLKMIEKFCVLTDENKKFIEENKKNPLTFILPVKQKNNLSLQTIFNETLSFRLPSNSFLKELFSKIDFPILATSANISGEKPPITFDDINISADLKIKGDESKMTGKSSTIIDLRTDKIIRQGEFKF